jgi:hypothetical protein
MMSCLCTPLPTLPSLHAATGIATDGPNPHENKTARRRRKEREGYDTLSQVVLRGIEKHLRRFICVAGMRLCGASCQIKRSGGQKTPTGSCHHPLPSPSHIIIASSHYQNRPEGEERANKSLLDQHLSIVLNQYLWLFTSIQEELEYST